MWVKEPLLLRGNQYIITANIKPLFSIMGDSIFKEPAICLQYACKDHSLSTPRKGAITDLAIHAS